jgi:isoleucyl-tRNA synthetase
MAQLDALGDELRFFLITSEARVETVPGATAIALRVTPTTALKCVRCWHRLDDVGTHAEHPELCGRCVTNVDGPGETRRFA